mmetsp:Transcript_146498/g.469958  ORF Transcript_146498/g.469958 Transcript_146498/m.469958 type:complete len:287 (+) Transcript_146498:695-1555(+)
MFRAGGPRSSGAGATRCTTWRISRLWHRLPISGSRHTCPSAPSSARSPTAAAAFGLWPSSGRSRWLETGASLCRLLLSQALQSRRLSGAGCPPCRSSASPSRTPPPRCSRIPGRGSRGGAARARHWPGWRSSSGIRTDSGSTSAPRIGPCPASAPRPATRLPSSRPTWPLAACRRAFCTGRLYAMSGRTGAKACEVSSTRCCGGTSTGSPCITPGARACSICSGQPAAARCRVGTGSRRSGAASTTTTCSAVPTPGCGHGARTARSSGGGPTARRGTLLWTPPCSS